MIVFLQQIEFNVTWHFQKALASVFKYTKNGLNTEASFDVKVISYYFIQ